jgi:8-amino-7-oxononanoate synthase
MSGLDWLGDALASLEREGLLRTRSASLRVPGPVVVRADGRTLLNLCSNDYLSLAARTVEGTAGAGASRLIAGDLDVHRQLEDALSAWLGVEATLLFSSGYAANVGVLSALAGPDGVIVSDALNHASIVDGCRLSRARVVVTPHLAVESVERALKDAPERRRIVVTDSYFSMDGTIAPLAELRAVCDRFGAALVVDEAHALGVWGPEGRGASAAVGVRPDVLMGTLGKSFGASGAFVSGSSVLTRWLWNRARSFVFSTGLAPSSASAALAALPEVRAGERTRRVLTASQLVRSELGDPAGVGPIIPLLIGDAGRTVELSRQLLDRGLFVQAIRPPTVPRETSRLRLTVQADHELGALREAAAVIRQVMA